jgi:hypothetical protein
MIPLEYFAYCVAIIVFGAVVLFVPDKINSWRKRKRD